MGKTMFGSFLTRIARSVLRPELHTCQICYPKNALSRAVSSVLVSQSGGTWGAMEGNASKKETS